MSKLHNVCQFQIHCEKAIGKLTEECLEAFKRTNDDLSRIQLIYDAAKQVPISIDDILDKNRELAEKKKNEGNSYFAKKNYENALQCYDEGIINCPQNSVNDRELLSILISNRSASNFELQEYRLVLDDLDYITEIGNYPSHLKYKLWIRKAKCYDNLQNKRLALEAYDEAEILLKRSKLDEHSLKKKREEIELLKNEGNKNQPVKQLPQIDRLPQFENEHFVRGQEFIAANSKIGVGQDDYQGRYIKAVEDINTGEIIVEEIAHCAIVDDKHALTNCQHCLVSVRLRIACPKCVNVIYCSSNCAKLAAKSYHRIECKWHSILFKYGASVNCHLALRIMSQRPLKYFLDKRNKLIEYMKTPSKKNAIKKKTYRSDDYDNVFFLCRNETSRKIEDLIHYACMSVYLLRILKFAHYFGEFDDNILSEDELFIGALILRHFQILQFNAHEIAQLENAKTKKSFDIIQVNYENVTIGAGLYPTIAFFNHSCDPSIIRYNVNNKMIIRAIKPIKADDIIYENYGPLYTIQSYDKRQEELKRNYWFECLCQPCTEQWPLFKHMNPNELRIPCSTFQCPYTFILKCDDDPVLFCPYCKNITAIFPYLKALMQLNELLPVAEQLLSDGLLINANRKFIEALELLYKYTRPPHPEIVKIQHKIKECLLHFGNKSCHYKLQL